MSDLLKLSVVRSSIFSLATQAHQSELYENKPHETSTKQTVLSVA